MTADRDPDVQRAIDTAVCDIARYLTCRILPGLDAATMARHIVESLHGDGWRPWPRSDKIPQPGTLDPATAHRGADLARKALQGDTDEA